MSDYVEPLIEARRLIGAISDACRAKEWQDAFDYQQELEDAVVQLGEAIVAVLMEELK
jgi:hypothetical protein